MKLFRYTRILSRTCETILLVDNTDNTVKHGVGASFASGDPNQSTLTIHIPKDDSKDLKDGKYFYRLEMTREEAIRLRNSLSEGIAWIEEEERKKVKD